MHFLQNLATVKSTFRSRIRFDRNELAGSFGDIGTDLPLIVGMILASGADSASVLVVFGSLQIATALTYGIPMPVQPLKAVATLVIAQQLSASILYGAGLTIGIAMLLLTATGLINWLAKIIPHAVIRGIQFGLGLQLSLLALSTYVPSDGTTGYVLAVVAFAIIIALLGNKRYPPALFVLVLGVLYALIFNLDLMTLRSSFGFSLPSLHSPSTGDMMQGFLLLALAQIPLSLGNSLLATHQLVRDYFPSRSVTLKKIGWTYSLMNIVASFFGGIPVCHGSGGIAGHYLFGARTGGSVLIYGIMYLVMGLLFSTGFSEIIKVFPLPILGVILLFEGTALMKLVHDTLDSPSHFLVAILVGVICVGVPYGYIVGMVLGTAIVYYLKRYQDAL